MTKTFKVAGHIFSLSIYDSHPVWNMLDNYLPFEIPADAPEAANAIFHCGLCKELPQGKSELYCKDNPEEDDAPRIDIYFHADGYLFEMRPTAKHPYTYKLWTDRQFRKGLLLDWTSNIGRFPVDNSLMLLFALRTAPLSTLEMHASVIAKDGKGYLFLGKSGTGKSTHSRMWLENIPDCMLLNDDNPAIRVMPDGSVRVFGTPWSGKTPCYRNIDCVAGGFVQIEQYPENIIRRQSTLESYISVYSSCSGIKFDADMADVQHSTIESVLGSVPCWLLKCLPDGDAAKICYKSVSNGDTGAAE